MMFAQNNQGDISIKCTLLEDCYKKTVDVRPDLGVTYTSESICEHNKGEALITNKAGNLILSAQIEMFGLAGFAESGKNGPSGFYVGGCGHATTEVHEILHTLGYEHTNITTSIMYPSEASVTLKLQDAKSCEGTNKKIDDAIIKDLIETYS